MPHTNRPVQPQKTEALNLGFKKKRDCTIRIEKTKAALTVQLICVFVFNCILFVF